MAYRPWNTKKRTPYRALVIRPEQKPFLYEHPWTEDLVPAYFRARTKRAKCREFWLDEGWYAPGKDARPNPLADRMLELPEGENVLGQCVILGWDPQLLEVISVSQAAVDWAVREFKKTQ